MNLRKGSITGSWHMANTPRLSTFLYIIFDLFQNGIIVSNQMLHLYLQFLMNQQHDNLR